MDREGKEVVPIKLVIPCAGKGTRMHSDVPKVLLRVNGRSLLSYITHYWSGVVDDLIIVASHENLQAIKHNSGKAIFVVQEPLRGIADAILQAERFVGGKFVVNLGDCLLQGEFEPKNFDLGIGVIKDAPYDGGYTVDVDGNKVVGVYEKSPRGRYLGMGIYFLDGRVFDYIRKTPPSALRNEVEITDVIQNMIDHGEHIAPMWFNGKYINVTYPADIARAEEVFK